MQDAGIDHGGIHISVAQQGLHRADVLTGAQQVRGEAVAEEVRGEPGRQPGLPHGRLDGALENTRLDSAAFRRATSLQAVGQPLPLDGVMKTEEKRPSAETEHRWPRMRRHTAGGCR